MSPRKRITVICRDCKVLCTADDLCPCCVAIERDRSDDPD